jgi:polar amino acid transport system substrate-binding protein
MKINRSLTCALQRLTSTLALVLMMSSVAAAQNPNNPNELNVAIAIGAPFVMQQNGALSGFSIDLWNAIAARMNVKTNYEIMPDAASLFEAMRSKRVEVVAVFPVSTSWTV